MLKITNVNVKLGETDYAAVISNELNMPKRNIKDIKILRKSIDARRTKVHFIMSFAFSSNNEEKLLKRHKKLSIYKPYVYNYLPQTQDHVVVVGSGPAGLFCAYVLAHAGNQVTVIERGSKIEKRVDDVDRLMRDGILNEKDNIAFGEGGAGTFSDGKLTTGTKNPRIRYVLDTFLAHGAPAEIGYDALPHIGTDRLRAVIINMRKELERLGTNFMFDTKFVDFYDQDDKHITVVENAEGKQEIVCDVLVLALGHSARDTYRMLDQKLEIVPKSFAVGVRIEQLQSTINKLQYKQDANSPYLQAAPYKLAVKTSEGRGVYTFCMCPGGVVVPSTEKDGYLCVNGMSYYARDKANANSAILVQVNPEDFPEGSLGGITFQEDIEKKAYQLGGNNLKAPVQKVVDYCQHKKSEELGKVIPSYMPGTVLEDINEVFPEFINRNLKEGLQLMNERMPGFIDEDTIITAVESRSSAPIRILRNQDMKATRFNWIYPLGEGAGYSGGIMSSAVDGIRGAEAILKRNEE
ncbi:NAD(P)/FAD-dependent oxidoreductase [Sharpea azabuensis]|uniref:NAD(P)/FAD-dependent oxidoreductase n=1 Tax=Sharpea azabuensis TaxID=322505 RepID=UPI002E806D93|nr:FAD-dependent oxidoreductase [Sharpea azabuensis]MEE3308190.1 FAD-dependent oxidoreductase [Sharpea azabuensis]